jgi:hypothetical protein
MNEARPTLANVAATIANGKSPPEWLAEWLQRHAPLISHGRIDPSDEDRALQRALDAIDVLDGELSFYATIGEVLGFEVPDCVDAASTALTELRYFFEGQRRPARKGGRHPDSRRRLCALVCANAWRRIHGDAHPYSGHLQEACEAYWQACGQPETPTTEFLKSWQRQLVRTTT